MTSPIGLPVWVRLKQPQNVTIHGVVQDLVPNSHLTLRDVWSPASPNRLAILTLQTSAIEDLGVVDAPPPQQQQQQGAPTPPQPALPPSASNGSLPPRHVSAPTQPAIATPTPQRHASAFVDPAIVSYGNASPVQSRAALRPAEAETPIKALLARAAQNLPSPSSPFIAEPSKIPSSQRIAPTAQTPSKQPPRPSVAVPDLGDVSQDAAQGEGDNAAKKKVRRGQKSKRQTPTPLEVVDPPPVMNAEVSRNGNDMNGNVKRGKGWRSTPLLQPSPQAASPTTGASSRKNRKKTRDEEFAQGDTTDIPDVDFDFEGELKKFDKSKVFDEIRQGDTTADEDLLVTHNRARPGTYGGKNLHPTENVLSPKVGPTYQSNSNELDSSSDADTELNFANGRSSSRHSVSRGPLGKRQPSRSNSGQHEAKPHPLASSITSERSANRSTSSLTSKMKAPAALAATSLRPDRAPSPLSATSATRLAEALQASHITTAHFVTDSPSTHVPVLLPQALEKLEEATIAAYGLTHEAFVESAAIRIAEAALGLSDAQTGFRRPSRTNTQTSTFRGVSMTSSVVVSSPVETPVVVILAGNHLAGARALGAARHLLRRNLKVIVAESSFESNAGQDAHFKAQSTVLRRRGREGANLKRGVWKKSLGHIKNLSGPPAVIIDALLAGSPYDALHGAHIQQECREMIDWANRSRAPVLSVACPSGVSGADGQAPVVDGEPLAVRPDRVLALGAPMHGLLKALEGGEKWDIGLADIGVDLALKSEDALVFGARWVVDLTLVEAQAGEGEAL